MTAYPKPNKSRFPFRLFLLGAVIGAVIYWGPGLLPQGGGAGAPVGPAGEAMPVSVAQVVNKSVAVWSDFSGKIEAVHSVEIRPRVGGHITAVHFKDGADVKAGAPLFQIDVRPYEAEVMRARGALASAESAQSIAAKDFARAKQLIGSKAISTAEYEAKASALNQANGALESARGALRAAEVNVNYTTIRAPIGGKISRAEITEGNVVDPAANVVLASIVTLSPIYASFDLDEQTFLTTIAGVPAAKLKKIPVEVGLANDVGTPNKATIHAFDNQIAPDSGTIRVRALIANKDQRLLPGLFAKVRIGSPDAQPSILINPTAIGTDQNKKFVFVVGAENKAEYREVVLGTMSDGLQIITSGLKEGERIVVNGLQRLRPGAPMIPTLVDMVTLKAADAPPAVAAP
jgi:multidrug efflux system membrane fusion protein